MTTFGNTFCVHFQFGKTIVSFYCTRSVLRLSLSMRPSIFSTILFVISVILLIVGVSTTECPNPCYCYKETGKVTCKDTSLTYIPKFPNNTWKVVFTGNNLPYVERKTFGNLVTLNLEILVFRHNNISDISRDAFSSLLYLRHLDLSGNKLLDIAKIALCLGGLNAVNITSIVLNSFGWKNEPTDIYQNLSSFKITRLSVSQNMFRQLHFEKISRFLPNLIYLNAAYNNIQNLVPGYLGNLVELSLHHNFIDVFGLFETNKTCNFPNLRIMNLTSNFVNYFENRFMCLDKLETLVLDRNPVKQILKDTFLNLTSLKSLHLNSMGDRLFSIEAFAFRSNSLNVLTFFDNNFPFTSDAKFTQFDAKNIFGGIPNLMELDLSGNEFNISDDSLKDMLSNLTNLRKLTIKSCRFRTIPTNIFPHMPHLQMLNLTKNHISAWNGLQVFGNISSLQVLRLDHNYINIFNETSFPLSITSNLTEVNMAFNPFFCSCKNLWFRKWIQERINIFSEFPDNYLCINPPELAGTRLSDYFPSDSECYQTNTFMHVLMSVSLVGIFTVIVVSLLYKGRWHIRYWIYLQRSKNRKHFSIQSGDAFIYSGFVVYSDEDRDWVIKQFLKVVENDNGHKMCIHHRDFEVGKLIVDNIADSMARSKKVILLLSFAMIQSDWCLFETRLAQRKFLNDDSGSLVVILLENIQKKDMPRSLRNLVDMTTYIVWTEEPNIQERFWTSVVNAIKD